MRRHGDDSARAAAVRLRRAEEALRESRDRLAAIVNTAVDGIVTIDERGIIESVNTAVERIFGYQAAEMIGQNVSMLMPSPYREAHDSYLANYLQTGVRKIIGIGRETLGRRKDGSTFPIDLAVSKVEQRPLFTGVIRDISQRKLLERQVLDIAAEEQRRFGQELHDSTGQELTGLLLMAKSLVDKLNEKSAADASLARKILNGLKRVHDQVRELARGLIPVELDAEGLRAALSDLATRTNNQQGVHCTFVCRGRVTFANNSVATQLYRIAREAVANALRHARAQHIELRLESRATALRLQITDDGVGLGARPAAGAGMGLRIMRYRAGLIGAELSVGPANNHGTVVACTLPKGNRHDC